MLLTTIMSLFSSILIGLAPCNSNCAALDQENTVNIKSSEELVSKNAITSYGYSITTPYELLSYSRFYDNLSNLADISTIGQTYTLPPYYYDNVYYVSWEYVNINDPDIAVTNYGVALSSVTFELTGQVLNNGRYARAFDVYFQFANNYEFVYSIYTIYDYLTTTGYQFLGSNYLDLKSSTGNAIYYLYLRSSSYLYTNVFNNTSSYEEGFNNGYIQGYNVGYDEGYDSGVERGKDIASNPASDIYQATYNAGKQVGDSEGYQRAISQGSTAATIFSGIVTVGLLPVNVLLTMFQYEVFGINIAGLVSGLFTIAIVIIIIRLVTGKKND